MTDASALRVARVAVALAAVAAVAGAGLSTPVAAGDLDQDGDRWPDDCTRDAPRVGPGTYNGTIDGTDVDALWGTRRSRATSR